MEIQTQNMDACLVLTPVIKRVGAVNSIEFKEAIFKQINDHNSSVLINLKEVDFIDSSGLGAIISILKDLERKNMVLGLCEVKPGILNLFKLTGVGRILKIFLNAEEGVGHFSSSS